MKALTLAVIAGATVALAGAGSAVAGGGELTEHEAGRAIKRDYPLRYPVYRGEVSPGPCVSLTVKKMRCEVEYYPRNPGERLCQNLADVRESRSGADVVNVTKPREVTGRDRACT
jgi:hypothetical protein